MSNGYYVHRLPGFGSTQSRLHYLLLCVLLVLWVRWVHGGGGGSVNIVRCNIKTTHILYNDFVNLYVPLCRALPPGRDLP